MECHLKPGDAENNHLRHLCWFLYGIHTLDQGHRVRQVMLSWLYQQYCPALLYTQALHAIAAPLQVRTVISFMEGRMITSGNTNFCRTGEDPQVRTDFLSPQELHQAQASLSTTKEAECTWIYTQHLLLVRLL